MSTIADLDTSRADIKSTPTGLVEYNNGVSLEAVIEIVRNILAESRVPTVADDIELGALTADEAVLAFKTGGGFYYYALTDAGAGIASTDGGYWNPDTTLTLLSLLNGVPANGDVPVYDSGTDTFIPGPPTVSALGWANITGKPAQITGIASTDLLVKHFNAASNKGIGTATIGNGNVIFAPLGHSVTSASNSTLILSKNLTYMTAVNDSVIITDATTLRPGTTPFTVNNCKIIGNPGDISGLFTGNVLENQVIIEHGGQISYYVVGNVTHLVGDVILSYTPAGGTPGNTTVEQSLTVGNDLTVDTGDVTVTLGNVAVSAGNVAVTGAISATGALSGAALTSTGVVSFTLTSYPDNATALAALGAGKLYRLADTVGITH
jgi:hypothetical protein